MGVIDDSCKTWQLLILLASFHFFGHLATATTISIGHSQSLPLGWWTSHRRPRLGPKKRDLPTWCNHRMSMSQHMWTQVQSAIASTFLEADANKDGVISKEARPVVLHFSMFFCWMETFTGVQGLCREGKFIVNLFGYTAFTAVSHTVDGKILHHLGCIKPYENRDRLGIDWVPLNVWSYMVSVMSLRKAAALQPEVDFPSFNFPSDLDPFIWQAPKNDWKLLPSVGTWLVT